MAIYQLNMVIFHSYVSLPEGNVSFFLLETVFLHKILQDPKHQIQTNTRYSHWRLGYPGGVRFPKTQWFIHWFVHLFVISDISFKLHL